MKMIKSVFFLNINLLVGIVLIHTGCKENDKSTSPKVPTYNMPQSNEPTKPKKPQPSVEWSYIPSGSFIMGSSIYEANRLPDENQHQVILSAFKMSKNEVTFEQYDAFCEATRREKPSDEGWGRGRLPVINVSWNDARAFASWMGCRLPTQAEWEYACRAGTNTAYSYGDDPSKIGDYAWFEGNSEELAKPVGKKKPNPLGLFDIHGNVMEWCVDHYVADTYSKQAALGKLLLNPLVIPSERRFSHIARGGSWADKAPSLRSASRRGSDKTWLKLDPQRPQSIWWLTSAEFVGLRVVRPVTEIPELVDIKSKVTRQSGN